MPRPSGRDFRLFGAVDAGSLMGRTARIEIVENNTGGWGHITADHFLLTSTA